MITGQPKKPIKKTCRKVQLYGFPEIIFEKIIPTYQVGDSAR